MTVGGLLVVLGAILVAVSANAIREHGVSGFASDIAVPAAGWALERGGAGDVVTVEASSASLVWVLAFGGGIALAGLGLLVLLTGALWALGRRSRAAVGRAPGAPRPAAQPRVPSVGPPVAGPPPATGPPEVVGPPPATGAPEVAGPPPIAAPPAAAGLAAARAGARRVSSTVEGRAREMAPQVQDLARRGRDGFAEEVAPRVAEQAARGRASAAKALSRLRGGAPD